MHPDLWRAEAILRRYGIVWPLETCDADHVDILVCDGIGVHLGSPVRNQIGEKTAPACHVSDAPNDLVHSASPHHAVDNVTLVRFGNSGVSDES